MEPHVICPKCGEKIPLQKAMATILQAQLDSQQSRLREEVQKEAEGDRKAMEDRIRNEAEAAAQIEINRVKLDELKNKKTIEDLQQQQAKLKADNETALAQKTRELETKEAQIKAEAERQRLDAERKLREDRIRLEGEVRQSLETDARLKEAENLTLIASLTKKAQDLEGQLRQTSQQIQGEAQEIVLEQVLRMAFPSDIIESVPKGYKGADCLQRVRTNGDVLGTIIWESKRTKQWLNEWLPKLKDDQRTATAEIAIIVTQTMPSEIKNKVGNVDGVWVTDFQSSIGVAMALRAGLIEVSKMRSVGDNSEDKTKQLYDFVVSTEFRQAIQAISETFIAFQEELGAEKRAMEKTWKKRELTITRALTATTRMHATLQNLLGTGAIPDLQRSLPS